MGRLSRPLVSPWATDGRPFGAARKDHPEIHHEPNSYTLTLSTVSSNYKANTILSNASQAWIFARASDAIVNRKPSDLVTTLPPS
jgi:hypothetical protein